MNLTKDQVTFLCRLADAFRNGIFEIVPASAIPVPSEDYMLVDMKRLTAGIDCEGLSRDLYLMGLISIQVAILDGKGHLVYKITTLGYNVAANALARRAIEDGYTLHSKEDVWNLYDLWS